MNLDHYLSVIHSTASENIHLDVIKPSTAKAVLTRRLAFAADVDAVKKGLFYGKHQDRFSPRQNDLFPEVSPHLEANKHMLHAIIGIDSESSELLQLLVDTVFCGQNPPNKTQILDEAGDLFWYFTMLLKIVGVSLEEVMDANYRKLSARFPEGTFSLQQWEGRDKNKELEKVADTLA